MREVAVFCLGMERWLPEGNRACPFDFVSGTADRETPTVRAANRLPLACRLGLPQRPGLRSPRDLKTPAPYPPSNPRYWRRGRGRPVVAPVRRSVQHQGARAQLPGTGTVETQAPTHPLPGGNRQTATDQHG